MRLYSNNSLSESHIESHNHAFVFFVTFINIKAGLGIIPYTFLEIFHVNYLSTLFDKDISEIYILLCFSKIIMDIIIDLS